MPTSSSLWTCTNVLEMRDWLVGWNHAKMEHSVRGVGKFDIALLRNEPTAKKAAASLADLAGVVEIIYKSPMKDKKVQQLNEAKIPWIEVEADASLWLHASRWTPEQGIPTFRTSEPAWTCHVCATGQQGIRLKRIMSIVDIFPSGSTKNQWGCIQRKIYSLYQRDSQFFLVEGNYIVITGWLQWYQINKEALLVSTTLDQLDQASICTEGDALAYLRKSYEEILRKVYEEDDPDAIVHPVIKWPGISIPELEARDELRHLVNYSTINSIPDLYGTIARQFGHAYTWDRRRHSWMRNSNYVAPVASQT